MRPTVTALHILKNVLPYSVTEWMKSIDVEREREREREKERERERERERQTDRQTERQTDRQRH